MNNEKDSRISRLVCDARVARKLLKMNGEMKYCPYCGKRLLPCVLCDMNEVKCSKCELNK